MCEFEKVFTFGTDNEIDEYLEVHSASELRECFKSVISRYNDSSMIDRIIETLQALNGGR